MIDSYFTQEASLVMLLSPWEGSAANPVRTFQAACRRDWWEAWIIDSATVALGCERPHVNITTTNTNCMPFG